MAAHATIGIIGSGGDISESNFTLAFETGALIAQRSAVLVCGGLGGIMEAASKGASEQGGTVVGILPGTSKTDANPYITIAIPTGMGAARNALVITSSDVVIAFPGAFGTLSEMALALDSGKSVIALPGAWDLKKAGNTTSGRLLEAFDAKQAVGMALGEMGRGK